MNIFFLSRNIILCALMHCDKHVVKMILEYTQMLYTANHENGGTVAIEAAAPLCASTQKRGYKSHAKNHPCTKWVRQSLTHYHYLISLALILVKEHTFRFSPAQKHACFPHLIWLRENPPPHLADVGWLDPPTAMPEEYRISPDAVQCYIAYYNGQKKERGLLKYTRRKNPFMSEE